MIFGEREREARHFPSFFRTTTTFASQLGYSTYRTNQAASNLSTLVWIIFCLSRWKHLTFYRVDCEEGMILSHCEATEE